MKLLPLFCLAVLAICVAQWTIYFYAPLEESMGITQKIFYLHLPASFWALISFFLVFVFSVAYLCKRRFQFDIWARSFAELGILYASIALLTGMVWAKTAWGVWWTWDPRLITTLIMWFVYIGYLILNSLELPRERKAILRAVVGIAAFLDVPLVFFSARIFRSIHPNVFASSDGSLESEMTITVVICIIAFGILWFSLALFRYRQLSQIFHTVQLELKKIYRI